MYGVLIFVAGLVFAVTHNRFRRICSLIYEQHKMRPPKGRIARIKLREPTICMASLALMWLSVIAFVAGASFVALRGITTVQNVSAQNVKSK
jgi:hypothetical protein